MTNTERTIEIIPFESQYAADFAKLNIEWLEKYFVVEPHDQELLENCEATIIDNDGYIFFARIDNVIAGTFALIKMKRGGYELGKMAVSPRYRGQQIGQQLMTHCLTFAKTKKWNKLTLYSSTKLANALHIYKKFGFREVPLESNSPYLRSDIKMELEF